MRYIFMMAVTLALAGCVEPPKKDAGPEPLPAHPAGPVTKGVLPPPAKAS